jgi:hypothetical protein
MQADDVPQHAIDALAELLLDMADQELTAECCSLCSNDADHLHEGQPFCDLCRECYDSLPQE